MLNRLEHYILNEQMDDWEPLFLLYRTAMDDVEGATLDLILEALVKLVSQGFVSAFIVNDHPVAVSDLTFEALKNHVQGRTEKDLREYPSSKEFYFKPTDFGRKEHSKKEYDSYYRS